MDNKIDTITAMLHAYIDGRLDDKARTKIKNYFSKQPTRAEEFKEFRTINNQLIHAYGISMDIAVPERFNAFIDSHDIPEDSDDIEEINDSGNNEDIEHKNDAPKKLTSLLRYFFPATRLITNIAVCVALVFVGFLLERYDIIGSGIFPTPEFSKIEQLAIDSHITYAAEKDHAVEIAAADVENLNEWISKRLEEEVAPAILDEFDFVLMGGRLLPSMDKYGAFYMYKNSSNARLTYYIRRISTTNSGQSLSCKKDAQSLSICQWSSKTLVYFLIGTEELKFMKELSAKAAI
jgi:anti-sigma factor RsiW